MLDLCTVTDVLAVLTVAVNLTLPFGHVCKFFANGLSNEYMFV